MGDEVVIPAFTCVAVPNSIIYLGATPVYADIDSRTYNLTCDTVEQVVTPRTRAIVVQNTFGASPDLDPILKFAKQRGIFAIEDCAHGLGSKYKNQSAGTIAEMGFYSAQWTKPITVGLGGIAYVRNKELSRKVSEYVARMPVPSLFEQMMLNTQTLFRPLVNHPRLYYSLVSIYRILTQRLDISTGSSSRVELISTNMPKGYAKRMGRLQIRLWQRQLKNLDNIVARRQRVAESYDEYFSSSSLEIPYRPDYTEHSMLRYAIRVPNKKKILERAREMRIPLGDWFSSPVDPVQGDLRGWGYEYGQCPIAEKVCDEVINLYTDRPLSKQQLNLLFEPYSLK